MLLYEPDGEVHPNVTVVMEGHRRLERGDMTAIEHMFGPDIAWHESGVVPPAQVYVGVPAVMAFWKRYFTAAGPDFRQDIVSIMANQEYVSSIVRLAGSKGSRQFTATVVDLMRMESGHIAEFWRFYEDPAAARAFFDG
jgi:ketosteroid isomerase-like protein